MTFAARMTDLHMCVVPAPPPAPPLPPPGVPNPIMMLVPPAPVLIGGLLAARMGDMAATGVPHPIVKASMTVTIGGKNAARMGDQLACGGMIMPPCCPTVMIGG